jgi:hypothetical protein
MTLQQDVWRTGVRGAEEAAELHLEIDELCAVGQEQLEGVAFKLPLASDMVTASHTFSCSEAAACSR